MEGVNYIKHLNNVFIHFSKDSRLNPTHISLYVGLFQLWNTNFFKDEFYINREEVMSYSKIGSKSTYHRCIKELSYWNYILYIPSHNPFKGSSVKMFDFGTSGEQAMYYSCAQNGTSNGRALVSINKQKQTIKNNKNLNKQKKLKKINSNNSKPGEKQKSSVSYRDNLKISTDKNYDEPL